MGFEVSRCNVACAKSESCLYAKSKQPNVLYDFRHVCNEESMYLEHFEGDYRDSKTEEKELITD